MHSRVYYMLLRAILQDMSRNLTIKLLIPSYGFNILYVLDLVRSGGKSQSYCRRCVEHDEEVITTFICRVNRPTVETGFMR